MSESLIAVVSMAAKPAVRKAQEAGEELESQLRAAMRAAIDNGIVTVDLHEEIIFKGAVAAVVLANDEEVEDRIRDELDVIRRTNALMAVGDFRSLADLAEKKADGLIGLLRIWKEERDKHKSGRQP